MALEIAQKQAKVTSVSRVLMGSRRPPVTTTAARTQRFLNHCRGRMATKRASGLERLGSGGAFTGRDSRRRVDAGQPRRRAGCLA